MPIIKSAKKRVKVAAKARSRNLYTKRQAREALKAFAAALEGGKPAEVTKAQTAAVKALDIAVKKNITHRNKAARFKSKMSAQAKAAGIKPSSELSRLPAKAGTGKATRKSTTGKPAKKATASKPAAKKTAPKK
jgi:small subunit ribosomal protein S20